jgi:hypothetical protein
MHFESSSSYNLSRSFMHAERSQKLWCGEVGMIDQDDIPIMMVSLGYGVKQNPTTQSEKVIRA